MFIVISLATIADIIYRGTESVDSPTPATNDLLKASIILACYVPFMVVRFLYGILVTFVESLRAKFSVLTGDITAFLCMAVLEEIFVVAFLMFTGMRLDRLPSALRNAGKPRDSTEGVEIRSRE